METSSSLPCYQTSVRFVWKFIFFYERVSDSQKTGGRRKRERHGASTSRGVGLVSRGRAGGRAGGQTYGVCLFVFWKKDAKKE